MKLSNYSYTHGSARSLDGPHGRCDIGGVQILEFLSSNLFHLGLGDFSNFGFVGLTGAFGKTRRFQNQTSRGRRLGQEAEGSVSVNGNNNWDVQAIASHWLSACIEFLAEHRNIDACGTQSWADWRSGIGSTCWNLQLDLIDEFLRHDALLAPKGK